MTLGKALIWSLLIQMEDLVFRRRLS